MKISRILKFIQDEDIKLNVKADLEDKGLDNLFIFEGISMTKTILSNYLDKNIKIAILKEYLNYELKRQRITVETFDELVAGLDST